VDRKQQYSSTGYCLFFPFDHSFRSLWAYSNYGIFLGQESAARAAGLTAPQLLSKAIFEPLGMTRSGPTQAELFKDANRVAARNIDNSIMPYENVDKFSGAGAVVSTGADIARWMRVLLTGGLFGGKRILAKATVTQIFAASMVQGIGGPLHDPNDSAGLGCESYHFLRYRVIEKNGALNGVWTIVTLIPERNIGIAVFANKQLTTFPEAVRAEFLERELGRLHHNSPCSGRSARKGVTNLISGVFQPGKVAAHPAGSNEAGRAPRIHCSLELTVFRRSSVQPLQVFRRQWRSARKQ
jgi:CubicO group peptidase (beta-lactamase class C family)